LPTIFMRKKQYAATYATRTAASRSARGKYHGNDYGLFAETAEAGTEITITGTNFGTVVSDVSITFGTSSAVTPKSDTNTQIVVVVPGGAVTGKIAVSVKAAAAVLTASSFTFNVKYIIKTVGISGADLFTEMKDGKLVVISLEVSNGGGTYGKFTTARSDLIIDAANIDKAVVNNSDSYPLVSFPKYHLQKKTSQVVEADTLKATTIKIKGFNAAIKGFNQVNYVLVDDRSSSAETIGYKIANAAELTDANIKSSLSGRVTVSGELAFN
jgi:hypothetical protein